MSWGIVCQGSGTNNYQAICFAQGIYSLVVAEVLMMMAFMQASKEIRYATCTCKLFQT